MSSGKNRLEKYFEYLMFLGLMVYCIVDIINYYAIFTDFGVDTTRVKSKSLSGTARNKRWNITYNYYANGNIFHKSTSDITPFSNTYKQDTRFYVYYFNKKPSKHVILPEKVRTDFSPNFMHYLTLDRNAVFYLKVLLFILFIKLIPLLWAIVYTIVGLVLVRVFRPIKYKRFMTRRKEIVYRESIGRIINKLYSC
ncbi:MAG: hypothetical protein ACOWWR_13175 [Eubacteriales bacterium]